MKKLNAKKIHPTIPLLGIITFFSIIATAVLHSNDYEFFNAMFGSSTQSLSEQTIIQYSSLYDSIYYIAFIAGLLIGPISDNRGKRKIFITVGSLAYIFFTLCLRYSLNFPILLVFRLLQGIAHIMVWQTLMVLVYDYSSKLNLAKSVSIYTIFMGMGMGLGVMFGGILANIGVFVPLFFSIISYSIVFILTTFLLKEPKKHHQRPSFQESAILIKKKPELIVPSLFNFVDRLHMGFLISAVPLYLTFVIPLEPGKRSMIFGMSAIPSLFLSYPVGKKSDESWGRFKPLIFGSMIYGIALAFTGILSQQSLAIFTSLLLIQGCAQGFTTTPTNSLLGDIVEPENNATAVSIFNFFGNIGMIIGPMLGLIFTDNYNLAFFVAGIIELVTLGLNVYLGKKKGIVDLIKIKKIENGFESEMKSETKRNTE